MPLATMLGSKCSGHDCFPPRNNCQASSNVFVEGIGWHRLGDKWVTHCCTCPEMPHGCHASALAKASKTVFVNGRGAGRIGDEVGCGSTVVTGVKTIFCGG